MLSDRWKRFDLNQDLKDLLRVHAEWVCGRIQISLEGHRPDYEKLKKEISVKDDDCIIVSHFKAKISSAKWILAGMGKIKWNENIRV